MPGMGRPWSLSHLEGALFPERVGEKFLVVLQQGLGSPTRGWDQGGVPVSSACPGGQGTGNRGGGIDPGGGEG